MRGTLRGGPTSSRAREEEHLLMGCNLGCVPRLPAWRPLGRVYIPYGPAVNYIRHRLVAAVTLESCGVFAGLEMAKDGWS